MAKLKQVLNRFYTEDDIQYLEITKLSGEKVYFIIDKEYVSFMKSKTWYAMYCPKRRSHYLESKDKIKYHRYITNCPDELVVDHIDRCTYNNKLDNLRICTVAENSKNRTIGKLQKNPKLSNTKIRYISYYNNGGKNYYYVVNFKRVRKRFKTEKEAIMFLNELKQRNEVSIG